MATHRLAFAIVLTFGITSVAVQGQTPPRDVRPQAPARQIPVGTAVISGVVTAADTGSPVRNARVTLSGTAGVIPAGRGVPPPSPDNPQPPTLAVSRTAYTDAQGRFTFAKIAAGRYSVVVNRDGYLTWGSGQRRPNTGAFAAIEVADGGSRTVAVSLSRGGVIAGRVTDEDGEPVRNALVQVARIDRTGGGRRLQQTNAVSTNDRGAYRAFGLQPGSYLVSVTPRVTDFVPDESLADMVAVEQAIASGRVQTPASGPAFVIGPPVQRAAGAVRVPSYLPVYYPGTPTAASAQTLTITGSEEREGVDLALVRARASMIRGVISPLPPPGTNVQISLINADTLAGNTSVTSANQYDGTFAMNNVPPGRHVLVAQTNTAPQVIDAGRVLVDGKPLDAGLRVNVTGMPRPDADATARLWARVDVVVGDDATIDVTVPLRPAVVVSGTIASDSRQGATAQVAQTLQLVALPGQQINQGFLSETRPDGSFTIRGVVPGRYYLRSPGAVRSATLGGQDILEVPFDVRGDRDVTGVQITLTNALPEVTGTLTDGAGDPVGNHLVVIAPADQRYWNPGTRRIVTATTGPYGRYTFRVPPGEYVVGPVEDFESGAEYDPEFIAALLAAGSRVTLTEGGSERRDFRAR